MVVLRFNWIYKVNNKLTVMNLSFYIFVIINKIKKNLNSVLFLSKVNYSGGFCPIDA